jgi:hypothetical protein
MMPHDHTLAKTENPPRDNTSISCARSNGLDTPDSAVCVPSSDGSMLRARRRTMAHPRLFVAAAAPPSALAPLCNSLSEVGSLLLARCCYLLVLLLVAPCNESSLPLPPVSKPHRSFLRSHRHSLTGLHLTRRKPCNSCHLLVLHLPKYQLISDTHNASAVSLRPIIATHVPREPRSTSVSLTYLPILVPDAAVRSPTPPHPSTWLPRSYSSGVRDNSFRKPLSTFRYAVLWHCR